MKIGVVHCGALGSYEGAKLCHDGQQVHFCNPRDQSDLLGSMPVLSKAPWFLAFHALR